MLKYVYIGSHVFYMREVMINLGSILAILFVAVQLYIRYRKREKGWRNILKCVVLPIGIECIIVFTIGSVLSKLIRGMTYILSGTLQENISYIHENAGSHFLGIVIASFLIFPPVCRKIFKQEAHVVENIVSFFFTIQHIFNRLGCFLGGCCYGIPAKGMCSVKFPEEILSYRVFPSQLFEVFCMLLLLGIQLFMYKKGKNIFLFTMAGFGISIFISEFLMDKSGTITYMNLTVIQYFALLLISGTAIACVVRHRRTQSK